jgi:NAD+ synthase
MFKDLLEINAEEEALKIISFLRQTFLTQKIDKAVIGVSGGIDSAVSLTLLSKALTFENIQILHLPYFKEETDDINKLFEYLKIPASKLEIFSIKLMVDKIIDELKIPDNDLVRRGNIMARVRMISLFDTAKKQNGLVVGTENRSEHFLGYFTRFGDEASDIEPIAHLYKTQVYEIAKYLKIPQSIIDKAPSANLWADQTDEGQFGFTYEQADPVLFLYFDKKNSAFSIERMFPGASKIIEFAEANAYKLKVPYEVE